MKCYRCTAEMKADTTTYVAELDDIIIVIKHVPCFTCEKCGECVYTGDVLEKLEQLVDSLKATITKDTIVEFPAA